MKKIVILLVVTALFSFSCGEPTPGTKEELTKADLKTEDDKVSYAIGVSIGSNFRNEELEMNLEILQQGIKDGFTDSKQLLDEEEINKTMMAFQQNIRAKKQAEHQKRMEEREEQGEANKEKEKEFLEANKTKEGVVTLESGLQYKILKEGTGACGMVMGMGSGWLRTSNSPSSRQYATNSASEVSSAPLADPLHRERNDSAFSSIS